MFSVVSINGGLFQISHIQVMNRCAGAGREKSQTANQSWPMEIFHTIVVMISLRRGWLVGRKIPAFRFSRSFESSLGWDFKHFFWAENLLLEGEKNCIIYSSFCIFIITIIISISVSISFLALLKCPYVNPWVFPLVHFCSPSCWRGKGGVNEQLSGA